MYRFIEWERALVNASSLYAVTDIVALFANRRMALSTVFHHICTGLALLVILNADLKEESPVKGETSL